MAMRTVLDADDELIPERTTPTMVCDILDENNARFTPTTLVGDLLDVDTDSFIASGLNLISHVASGQMRWLMPSGYTCIVTDVKDAKERHRLNLRWTWDDGNRSGAHEIDHFISNMQVPR